MNLVIFLILSLFTISFSKDTITTREELQELLESKSFEVLSDYDDDDVNLQKQIGGDECLVDKSTAKNLLKIKYGITSAVDKHLRFIVGKCNPVLLIPGVFATKLIVEVNCQGLYTKEKETTFRDLRVFCGDTVCNDTSVISEEHPLMIALFDNAFSILDDGENNKKINILHV